MNVHSQQHVLVMCATAFYLVENYPLDVGPDFSASIIQVCGPASPPGGGAAGRLAWGRRLRRRFGWGVPLLVQLCGVMLSGSEESTPSTVYHCVLRGLERLLLSEQLSRLDAESLVKLSVDRVNVHSPHRAMAALGLMLTCMYTGERRGPRRGPLRFWGRSGLGAAQPTRLSDPTAAPNRLFQARRRPVRAGPPSPAPPPPTASR